MVVVVVVVVTYVVIISETVDVNDSLIEALVAVKSIFSETKLLIRTNVDKSDPEFTSISAI